MASRSRSPSASLCTPRSLYNSQNSYCWLQTCPNPPKSAGVAQRRGRLRSGPCQPLEAIERVQKWLGMPRTLHGVACQPLQQKGRRPSDAPDARQNGWDAK